MVLLMVMSYCMSLVLVSFLLRLGRWKMCVVLDFRGVFMCFFSVVC